MPLLSSFGIFCLPKLTKTQKKGSSGYPDEPYISK